MEIDIAKLNIAQLYQVYGEITLQLELLSQKHQQVKSFIAQKSNEMQETKKAAEALVPAPEVCDKASQCCNGTPTEAA